MFKSLIITIAMLLAVGCKSINSIDDYPICTVNLTNNVIDFQYVANDSVFVDSLWTGMSNTFVMDTGWLYIYLPRMVNYQRVYDDRKYKCKINRDTNIVVNPTFPFDGWIRVY